LSRVAATGKLPRMSDEKKYRWRFRRHLTSTQISKASNHGRIAQRTKRSCIELLRPSRRTADGECSGRRMPARTPALLKTATASLRATFVLAIIIWAAGVCAGTGLQSATAKAFDDYINKTEARMADELLHGANFLWIDGLATDERSTAYEDLRAGRVAVENARGTKTGSTLSVPGGLIHDWKGVVFVPGVSLDETLALLEDYDHDDDYFSPDVIRSKLLARDGDNFKVYLRLKRKYVVTAVFDTEYDVRYGKLNGARAVSQSRGTHIEEIQNAGESNEQGIAPDHDHGYLWRLNSYWRFEQANGGVFIQCEAISLSRDVPEGLGWAVGPFIEQIPRESLRFTLQATRAALLKKVGGGVHLLPGVALGVGFGFARPISNLNIETQHPNPNRAGGEPPPLHQRRNALLTEIPALNLFQAGG
jgi:hypothetical protein